MKKNLFSLWLLILAVFFTSNISAQVTLGNTNGVPKTAEAFSALEIISNGKGGLRLPQLTTAQRNTLALAAISDPIKKGLANGLSIYNTTTNCVEYWNSNRWISLCEGTSQTTISPQPCTNVAADGTGCDQTFTVADPDCPNGPFAIAIVGGSDYATLTNVNATAGTFKVDFKQNDSVTPHTVLVRVTNSCTNQFKDFIFMQNAATCEALGTAPAISPSNSALSLCIGGAVYLSVDPKYASLDKLIWTRNGVEVARGVNYYVATMKGTYNVSLGAVGCNVNSANERVVTEGGTAPTIISTIISSNNGIICGSGGSITLTALGASGTVSWFKDGVLSSKTGTKITLTASDEGNWFAAAGSGGCYSKPSNTLSAVVVNPSGTPITINTADVLVNNKPINNVTSFCSGGSLVLKVNNPQPGVSYTWYNDETIIASPYMIPAGQTSLLIRMVATDNSGAACPVEARSTEVPITSASAPGTPTITGNGVICDGSADLTIVPKESGTYTYQWYKNGTLLSETTQTITTTEPGVTYTATVTNTSGCTSAVATKTIATEVSSLPILSWVTKSEDANYGDKLTYQVAIENGPATYAWSVDGGATFIGTGSSISVTYPSSGTAVNIKVKATNACGTSQEITKVVQLSSACPTPTVAAASDTTLSTVAGIGVQAKVTVTNGNQQTYQWYSNTTASTTGGTAISGATSATVNYVPTNANTVYLYCVVTNGCQGNLQGSSPVFTVNVTADPSTLTAGSGMFTGKTCFDINKSNYGSECGTQAGRASSMVDFKTQNIQPYVFTASAIGTKQNLRFVIVDPLGAVQSTNADAMAVSGTISNSQVVTLTVTYKNTLSDAGSIVYGKTTSQAVNVKIYAVYNDGTKDVSVPVNVKIQDCACCGAFIAAGVWKTFMCHNLGVDQSLDPSVVNHALIGNYYVYGQDTPSIPGSSLPYVGSGSNGWAKTTANPTKGLKDPCPAGYRIPTKAEWAGVVQNNTVTTIGTILDVEGNTSQTLTGIYKVGTSLYVPASGTFNTNYAPIYAMNYRAWYFASDAIGSSVPGIQITNYYKPTYIRTLQLNAPLNVASPVRCMEQ
jgi:hypothetical protein